MKREKTIWYQHQKPSTWQPEISEGSMYDVLEQAAARYPNLYALYFEGRRTRYYELLQQIEATAKAFQALGVKQGDIVSIMAPNMPQTIYSVYALNRLGAVANMLSPLLSGNEVHNLLHHTESHLLITLDQLYEKIVDRTWESQNHLRIILLRVSDALPTIKSLLYRSKEKHHIENSDLLYWRTALRRAQSNTLLPASPTGDDTAVILYSSGTTGIPKGAMLSNRNFNALSPMAYDTLNTEDVSGMQVLSILPFFHAAGLGVCLHATLCHAMQIYLIPVFNLNKCIKLIFKNKVEHIYGVPAFFDGVARSKEIETKSCSFIKSMGSCGDNLPDRIRDRIDYYLKQSNASTSMTNGYGLTETTGGCCFDPYFHKKRGSTGLMLPDMYFKIVTPGTQEEVPVGETGELCITGPTVMQGYYKNEEATEKVLQRHMDGKIWLHTGDAFYADEDGYLYFQQRLDRMFIVSGYNVFPTEVENEILKVPSVTQCCVVGKKAAIIGHKAFAYLVLQSGADETITLEKVRQQCNQSLAEYARPSRYVILPELPLTRMRKIDYKALEKL